MLSGVTNDSVGVASVTWDSNRGFAGTATGTSSWSVANCTLLSGDNVITVTANTARGSTAQDVITVTLDQIPPTIQITTPTSGATLNVFTGNLTLGGVAADNVGLQGLFWHTTGFGGFFGGVSGSTTWSTVNLTLQAGMQIVEVTASDLAGNTTSDSVTVNYFAGAPLAPTGFQFA